MCVLLITRLLRGVGRWARKPVNHTSWVAVVTPTDRPKSVRNRCLIELFCGVVFVVALPFWHFCWCRGFCHRTGSDLLLFVLTNSKVSYKSRVCFQHAKHVQTFYLIWYCLVPCQWNQAWRSSEVYNYVLRENDHHDHSKENGGSTSS